MGDHDWERLLDQIHSGAVVPVVGAELLVGPDGHESLQRKVAERVLKAYGRKPPGKLPRFRELNAAISIIKSTVAKPRRLYYEVHTAIAEIMTGEGEGMPAPINQLAQITDFRLFVTLTPDGLLERGLSRRCLVNSIPYSPNLETRKRADLDKRWKMHRDKVQLLYLFGKSCDKADYFAIHDEDILEYAHALMSDGKQVERFLSEIRDSVLLMIGCGFPDWLSRFFLRLVNRQRLQVKEKCEWMIEKLAAKDALADFIRCHSSSTELFPAMQPVEFVAELHRRWVLRQQAWAREPEIPVNEKVPSKPLFFISYSRSTDLEHAQALYESLRKMGLSDEEVWFDRQRIEPGQAFESRIFEGIRGCRYFLPLLSTSAVRRDEAFVFKEWREAYDRLRGMSGTFVVPVIVDKDFDPNLYTSDPARLWATLDIGHAPGGFPDQRLRATLTKLLRDVRRSQRGIHTS